MADVGITFLLERLTQLLESYVDLVSGAENELHQLQNELGFFKAFLQQAAEAPKKEDLLRETERQIREVVYEAEDTIDACLTQVAAARASRNPLERYGPGRVIQAKQVKSLREDKVKPMIDKLPQIRSANRLITGEGSATNAAEPTRVRKVQLIRKHNIVGFEDEEKKIVDYLHEKTEKLDVVSIIGMPGLGKTTLAWKICQNRTIQEEFPIRIWVYVSQELNTRDLFLNILKGFTKQDKSSLSEDDLATEVCEWLENEKFLLVLDDVWTTKAWDDAIKCVLPKRNNSGKVLITSRDREVGAHANVNREPLLLRFFNQKESWELLQLEVFGNLGKWPENLKTIGEDIAHQCAGLPLAIVVVGGILLDQLSATREMNAIQTAWKNVSENVTMHVNDKQKGMSDIVELSYNKLPDDLRYCFLYLGVFPEDYEIPAWTLTRLWIAEGFVQQKKEQSLEEAAEENLKDLINKNLVMIDKRKPNGGVKTCRVHDVIREFCKSKAAFAEQNLFQEIKMSKQGVFKPPVSDLKKYRRLCMHFHLHDFLSKCISDEQKCPHVRSFLCLFKEPIPLQPQYISAIPDTFDLLRVLDSKSVKFTEFPKKVTKLIHLRYITLSCDNLNVLPDAISKLWNLQTLVVDTKERTLQIKASIWKMIQLRHVKTKAAIILAIKGEGQGGENLQTLSRLSPKSCTQDVFKKAGNLNRLGIRGDLTILFKAMSLQNLVRLENLKLVNDLFYGSAAEGPSLVLPPVNCFPPNVKTLTLSATFLKWRDMSTLAMIPTLEVLKLKDKAFMEKEKQWSAVGAGFPRLQFLLIASTDLRIWEASDDYFPSLKCLVLKNCRELCKIPFSLAKTLHVLDIEHVSQSAVESARDIESYKRGMPGQQKGIWETEFKLNVGSGCE